MKYVLITAVNPAAVNQVYGFKTYLAEDIEHFE